MIKLFYIHYTYTTNEGETYKHRTRIMGKNKEQVLSFLMAKLQRNTFIKDIRVTSITHRHNATEYNKCWGIVDKVGYQGALTFC